MMGDKEGSTEGEDVGEEEIKSLLHCSLMYPLPEEIKKMEHSETVCCYCGVSYLIFHEFHQLHMQLAQSEAELRELRGRTQKHTAQSETLDVDKLEWERELQLQLQRRAEIQEKTIREELEERNRDTMSALREDFVAKYESMRKEMEEEYQKTYREREKQLIEGLRDLEIKKLRKQREDLEKRAEEREKVLRDELQKANKSSEDLRNDLQQLEERLVMAASAKEEAETELREEQRRVETVRSVCARQRRALGASLSLLRFFGSGFTDLRGFLSQLTQAWKAVGCQILQHITQVFSASGDESRSESAGDGSCLEAVFSLSEELRHSTVELQKMKEEKEHLTQQLMEQERRRDEQLSQQEDAEKEHKGKLLRLTVEVKEKNEKWLLCQQRCDAIQVQLLSWEQRGERLNQKCRAAVEEVTQIRESLEEIQQEKRELMKERNILIESHDRAQTKIKQDYEQRTAEKLATALEEHRSQNALRLREQMEELRREAELKVQTEREKNQMLLSLSQRDNSQLQQKLEERGLEVQALKEELQQERRSREEERKTQEMGRKRGEEEKHQRARAELSLLTERNAELMEEVVLLQETVRRECEEREELTAALCQAQQEFHGRRSAPSHQSGSSRPPPDPTDRRAPQKHKNIYRHSPARVPLTRTSVSPNTFLPFRTCTDKTKSQAAERGGAEKSLESRNRAGVLSEGDKREWTLPRLKTGSAVSEVKPKVTLMMGTKEKL